jgi:hypothetical protein
MKRRTLHRCGMLLYWSFAWLVCAYAAAVAWAWTPGPAWLAVLIGLAVFIPAWTWGFVRGRGWQAWIGRGLVVTVVLALCMVTPSRTRSWSVDQSHTVTMEADGAGYAIHDIRHCSYEAAEAYAVRWETRFIDPERIDEVWYAVEPFSPDSPAAHTFLSFGIEDGKGGHNYLAVSVEIRRDAGEMYSPLAGLFRRYELMYVLADENDVIGLRAIHRRHDVFLYPVKATRDQARVLFLDMLSRAVALGRKPEFYHTLTNTCASNIAEHLRRRWPQALPRWDLRILLPGNADALALERGLLDCSGSIHELRKTHNISAIARQIGDTAPDFSERIRVGLHLSSSEKIDKRRPQRRGAESAEGHGEE